jgi:hypothetical protein
MSDARKRKRRVQPQLILGAPKQYSDDGEQVAKKVAVALDGLPPAPIPPKQQRWTELTAVGHIIADEILLYQQENHSTLSKGEVQQLRSWSDSVQNRIYQQTTLVLENVKLATEMRQKQREVELMRDDLMVLRTQTKQFRDEASRLGNEAETTANEASIFLGASQFLTTLESLAKRASCQHARDKC